MSQHNQPQNVVTEITQHFVECVCGLVTDMISGLAAKLSMFYEYEQETFLKR